MNLLSRFVHWWRRKSAGPSIVMGTGWQPLGDGSRRVPTPIELLNELKNTAWSCASINSAVCASLPPRLFVSTAAGQMKPRCLTRSLDSATLQRIATVRGHLPIGGGAKVEEVLDHPILTLLQRVNSVHNAFDLWELTQLSLEVHGSAFWLIDEDPLLHQPSAIWILPTHLVTVRRSADSTRLVDAYEYRGPSLQRFAPERIVHFRYPDPREPYLSGLSPLRACFEQARLTSDYAALKHSVYDNAALPSVLITPQDGFGPEERDRLEEQWRNKLSRGGQGKALVADSALKVTVLSHSMGDLAALADMKATKEDIANAFHVPLPFLSGDTNLANMQAADHLHKTLAIVPRLRRRDEKLNEQLIPRFDGTGRLFFATPDPTPANQAFLLAQEQADLKLGVRTINEVRASRGLPPVAWGDGR